MCLIFPISGRCALKTDFNFLIIMRYSTELHIEDISERNKTAWVYSTRYVVCVSMRMYVQRHFILFWINECLLCIYVFSSWVLRILFSVIIIMSSGIFLHLFQPCLISHILCLHAWECVCIVYLSLGSCATCSTHTRHWYHRGLCTVQLDSCCHVFVYNVNLHCHFYVTRI